MDPVAKRPQDRVTPSSRADIKTVSGEATPSPEGHILHHGHTYPSNCNHHIDHKLSPFFSYLSFSLPRGRLPFTFDLMELLYGTPENVFAYEYLVHTVLMTNITLLLLPRPPPLSRVSSSLSSLSLSLPRAASSLLCSCRRSVCLSDSLPLSLSRFAPFACFSRRLVPTECSRYHCARSSPSPLAHLYLLVWIWMGSGKDPHCKIYSCRDEAIRYIACKASLYRD